MAREKPGGLSALVQIERLRKRAKHFHFKRAIAAEFGANHLQGVQDDLLKCEETDQLVFCSDCGATWYVTYHCRKRVCPLCGWRLMKERKKVVDYLTRALPHPKMLTLTMPRWTGDVREGVYYIRKQFMELRRSALFANVKGGAYQIELKKKEDGWHIHIHALMECGYMPYQKIWSKWRALLKCDCPQVNIIAATSPGAKEYILKYMVKSGTFEGNKGWIVEWYKATLGIRLFSFFGQWYDVQKSLARDVEEFIIPKSRCPFCNAEGCVFPARAGPHVFPPKDWASIRGILFGSDDDYRKKDGYEEILGPAIP